MNLLNWPAKLVSEQSLHHYRHVPDPVDPTHRVTFASIDVESRRFVHATGGLLALLGIESYTPSDLPWACERKDLEPLFDAAEKLLSAESPMHCAEYTLYRNGMPFSARVLMDARCGSGVVGCVFEDITALNEEWATFERRLLQISHLTGPEFLWATVQLISESFNDSMAAFSVPTETPGRLRTLAAWHKRRPADAFEYDMAGTPCELVFGNKLQTFYHDVQQRFPDDQDLVDLDSESYMGLPLFDSYGVPLGLLYVTSELPITDDRLLRRVLFTAGGRAGMEFIHARSEAQLVDAYRDTVTAFSATVEKRDPYTGGHQSRTADIAARIATALRWPAERIDGLRMGALVHDIGKMSIPAEILVKPGALTDAEKALVQTHPTVGYDILKDIKFPWPVAEMVLQHHERMDGSGYPNGLAGDEIIPEARVLAIADVVESMSSHRPYRASLGLSSARKEIRRGLGTAYDREIGETYLGL